MQKRGFFNIIPLLIIAFVTIGALGSLSYLSDQKKKEAVGKVLSENTGTGSGDHGGSSGQDIDKSGNEGDQSSQSTNPTSSNTKIESKTESTNSKIEINKNKTKIEVKSKQGKFEHETDENKQETKIETKGLKIEIKFENGQRIVKIKNEQEEEIEASPEAENELLDEASDKLEEEDIKIASGSAGLGFIQHGRKVRTNFPLTVDPSTGQLFVTTPAGTKVVAILPDVAIQNMLAAGILTHVDQTPSPSPSTAQGGTPSAGATISANVAGAAIELTDFNNQPVYEISGIRDQKLLGILPVEIKLKALVSIRSGQLVAVKQGILSRLLDIFSF